MNTKRIVINNCDGQFSLSQEAANYIKKRSNIEYPVSYFKNYKNREHVLLIECIEVLGDKVNASFSKLEIIEIPKDVQYTITENVRGFEQIHELHRIWPIHDDMWPDSYLLEDNKLYLDHIYN